MNAPDRAALRDDARRACIAATVRDDVRALTRYAVADAGGCIKLDAMENPYALPAEVAAALGEAVSRVPINRYPDGDARAVKDALRAALKLPASVSLLLGNGSDELIQILTSAVAGPAASVLAHAAAIPVRRPAPVMSTLAIARGYPVAPPRYPQTWIWVGTPMVRQRTPRRTSSGAWMSAPAKPPRPGYSRDHGPRGRERL